MKPKTYDWSDLNRAIKFATDAHAGQFDKAGEPYIEHCLRVMLNCETIEEKIVALLHDVIEDKRATFEEVEKLFGYNIAHYCDILNRKTQDDLQYYRNVSILETTLKVKHADIDDNCNRKRLIKLDKKTSVRLISKYARAKLILLKFELMDEEPSEF